MFLFLPTTPKPPIPEIEHSWRPKFDPSKIVTVVNGHGKSINARASMELPKDSDMWSVRKNMLSGCQLRCSPELGRCDERVFIPRPLEAAAGDFDRSALRLLAEVQPQMQRTSW
jgi:hypothetical protein